jgi:hypothetical protein
MPALFCWLRHRYRDGGRALGRKHTEKHEPDAPPAPFLHQSGLLCSFAKPVKKSCKATLPASVAACPVLKPVPRTRAGSGCRSR